MNAPLIIGMMLGAALLGSVGQIMLRKASDAPLSLALAFNPWLLGFAFCYGIAVLINIMAYRMGGSVSFVYPIIATSYIFAALFAWKFLGETPNALVITGIAFIIVGVAFIGFGANSP